MWHCVAGPHFSGPARNHAPTCMLCERGDTVPYLGKEKVYKMAVDLSEYDNIPACDCCNYITSGDYELLEFRVLDLKVDFIVYKCGVFVKIEAFNKLDVKVRNDFISNLSLAMRSVRSRPRKE